MPAQVSYPGVYIEEIPSGVRTITGVSTSITAFIGSALKGPVNKPITINNYGDFERRFGGLWLNSTMSYAVRDFYKNGGSKAIIVRITGGIPTDNNLAKNAEKQFVIQGASSPPASLTIQANSPGEWGNHLALSVNQNVQDPTVAPSSPPVPNPDNLFNLIVYQKNSEGDYIKIEEHSRVSLDKNKTRYIPRVLKQYSSFIEIAESVSIPDDLDGIILGETMSSSPPILAKNRTPIELLENGSDGGELSPTNYQGSVSDLTGLQALRQVDLFNLLCIPPPNRNGDTSSTVYSEALTICNQKRAILIVDPPCKWGTKTSEAPEKAKNGLSGLGLSGIDSRNAALYFPRVLQADPLRDGQIDTFVPCGIIAGCIAKNDRTRGVWKSPAGIEVGLNGISGLQVDLSDAQNGELNPLGINCFRSFPTMGRVSWGARTLRGADILADEYKYLAVRRLLLFLQESLYRGLQWVVFEPNDEPLWAQIRLNVGAFMHNLYRQGAFQGKKKEAYFVKCDSETTNQTDINSGIVNVVVGFAPLKPAEFVIIKFQQIIGDIES